MREALVTYRLFFAIQLFVLLMASVTFDRWGVLRGIVAAQAALAGIWLGVGPIRKTARKAGAILAAALFVLVGTVLAARLPIGGLFGMHGYGWEFLMWMVRVLAVGGLYWQGLLRKGYVLSRFGEPLTDGFLRIRLPHLLVVASLVALYFVVTGNLGSGAFYGFLTVTYIILLGLAYAAMSLLASLLILQPIPTPGTIVAYVLGILVISFAIAGHTYDQTDRWASAQRAWLMAMIELMWLAGSLLTLRVVGFRISRQSVAAEPAASVAYSLRFSLRALFVALTLIAVWLGWNVSIVRKRDRLRELINGTTVSGRSMAVITQAEGDARAPREVKERIAPHVVEAFGIRNRGGTMIGPRGSPDLSLVRRWLGDEAVFIILLDHESELQDEVAAAFPEAMIAIRDGVEEDRRRQLNAEPTEQ
jgi:hypothetical protein